MSDDKTLLPELLPAPRSLERLTPPERVAVRAMQMLARFRGVGATAGAAVIGVSCGYAVVDPLPPPPAPCTSSPPDAFASVVAYAGYDRTVTSSLTPALMSVSNQRFTGITVADARVQEGRVLRIDDNSDPSLGTQIQLHLAPNGPLSVMLIEIDLECGGQAATRRFRIRYRQPTAPSDSLEVESL
jgi:hypothetical protein